MFNAYRAKTCKYTCHYIEEKHVKVAFNKEYRKYISRYIIFCITQLTV